MTQQEFDLEKEGLWSLQVRVDDENTARDLTDCLEGALDPEAMSVSMMRSFFGSGPEHEWVVRALYAVAPAPDGVERLLRENGLARGLPLDVAAVPDADWVTESQKGFPPIFAGRFAVADDDHWADLCRHNPCLALRINPGAGFGTGHHGSTRGCLLSLDALARRYRPRHILDLGCGSGILAVAAARLWRRPVMASDIDARSVAFAARSLRDNAVAPFVRLVQAPGFRHPRLRREAPYDLVCANILARPLVLLGPALRAHSAARGFAIVSGFYVSQEAYISSAFRGFGFRRRNRVAVDDWITLTFQRG